MRCLVNPGILSERMNAHRNMGVLGPDSSQSCPLGALVWLCFLLLGPFSRLCPIHSIMPRIHESSFRTGGSDALQSAPSHPNLPDFPLESVVPDTSTTWIRASHLERSERNWFPCPFPRGLRNQTSYIDQGHWNQSLESENMTRCWASICCLPIIIGPGDPDGPRIPFFHVGLNRHRAWSGIQVTPTLGSIVVKGSLRYQPASLSMLRRLSISPHWASDQSYSHDIPMEAVAIDPWTMWSNQISVALPELSVLDSGTTTVSSFPSLCLESS